MSHDPQSPSDRLDGEPDEYDGRDWNGRLFVTDPPKDGTEFWAVTDDGLCRPLAYSDDYWLYTHRHTWVSTDGEPGAWEADEISGWTRSYEEARDACEQRAVAS